jgi:ribosomal protein S18 acetylase RimI-like enzyme
MAELIDATDDDGLAAAGQLLHDFEVEYDEPTPGPDVLAERFAELVARNQVTILLARDPETREPVGFAALRILPSFYNQGNEAYLAELYVVPDRRGHGFGRELITEAKEVARDLDADYMYLLTSEEDRLAQKLYEAAGFRRTEGEDGAPIIGYEQDL